MAPGISTWWETDFLLEKTCSPDNTQFGGKSFIRTRLPGEAVVLPSWWRAMPSQWHWFILNVTALKCHQLGAPLDTLCVNQLSLGFSGTTAIWTHCKSTPLCWAFTLNRKARQGEPTLQSPGSFFADSQPSCYQWEQFHCCSKQSEPRHKPEPGSLLHFKKPSQRGVWWHSRDIPRLAQTIVSADASPLPANTK